MRKLTPRRVTAGEMEGRAVVYGRRRGGKGRERLNVVGVEMRAWR